MRNLRLTPLQCKVKRPGFTDLFKKCDEKSESFSTRSDFSF